MALLNWSGTAVGATMILWLAGCCHHPPPDHHSSPPDASYQQKLTEFASELTNGNNVPNLVIVPAPANYPIGAVLDARFTGSVTDKLSTCTIPPSANTSLTISSVPPLAGGNTFSLTLSLPQQLSKVIQGSINAGAVRQVSLGFDNLQEMAPVIDQFEAAIKQPACVTTVGARPVSIVAGTISGVETYNLTSTVNGELKLTLGSSPVFDVSDKDGPGQPATITEKSASVHFLILYTPGAVAATAGQPLTASQSAIVVNQVNKVPPPPHVADALEAGLTNKLIQ